ncbi:hypothetical protein DEJ48_14195 [Streptomyces venezuelae]|uniref:Uncharacterized protein n=1 Tax=Streptomyces venezuelae TaxID=54571 RepID=A0A5P2BVA3_STRVZ|nr:hypothetical protein DEJ48_14195 [Streptomyces venezuelae]
MGPEPPLRGGSHPPTRPFTPHRGVGTGVAPPPFAARGGSVPPGPPAADDESRTGGAGGNGKPGRRPGAPPTSRSPTQT